MTSLTTSVGSPSIGSLVSERTSSCAQQAINGADGSNTANRQLSQTHNQEDVCDLEIMISRSEEFASQLSTTQGPTKCKTFFPNSTFAQEHLAKPNLSAASVREKRSAVMMFAFVTGVCHFILFHS